MWRFLHKHTRFIHWLWIQISWCHVLWYVREEKSVSLGVALCDQIVMHLSVMIKLDGDLCESLKARDEAWSSAYRTNWFAVVDHTVELIIVNGQGILLVHYYNYYFVASKCNVYNQIPRTNTTGQTEIEMEKWRGTLCRFDSEPVSCTAPSELIQVSLNTSGRSTRD